MTGHGYLDIVTRSRVTDTDCCQIDAVRNTRSTWDAVKPIRRKRREGYAHGAAGRLAD
jgi:hypothetical protein